MRSRIDEKAYTLVEIIITMALGAIVVTFMTIALFNFRDSFQYDLLLNSIVESVNYVKLKSIASELDSSQVRNNYSIKFFEDRFVEFEGSEYVEGASTNIATNVPVGLRLSTACVPNDNGIATFSPIIGENVNFCTIEILKIEQPSVIGTVIIGKFGVEQGQ